MIKCKHEKWLTVVIVENSIFQISDVLFIKKPGKRKTTWKVHDAAMEIDVCYTPVLF